MAVQSLHENAVLIGISNTFVEYNLVFFSLEVVDAQSMISFYSTEIYK